MNSSECLRVLIPSQVTLLTVVVGLFLPASLDHVIAHVSGAHRLFPLSPGFSRVRARGCALRWAPYPTTAPWPPGTSLMPALPGEEQGVVTVLQAAGFAGSRPVWWRQARFCCWACGRLSGFFSEEQRPCCGGVCNLHVLHLKDGNCCTDLHNLGRRIKRVRGQHDRQCLGPPGLATACSLHLSTPV